MALVVAVFKTLLLAFWTYQLFRLYQSNRLNIFNPVVSLTNTDYLQLVLWRDISLHIVRVVGPQLKSLWCVQVQFFDRRLHSRPLLLLIL